MTEETKNAALVERPDPAGIVRRGKAAEHVGGYTEEFGEPPPCCVGGTPGAACGRGSIMEVYGLPMCGVHGEEAAFEALEEIAYDLEQELERSMNPHVRRLSPHLERALRHADAWLPEGTDDYARGDALLLEAFPLARSRTSGETLAYVQDPERGRDGGPPYDEYKLALILLCRHMRLAFEEGATWLVEMLEQEREEVAAQAAYALALEREVGLRGDHE